MTYIMSEKAFKELVEALKTSKKEDIISYINNSYGLKGTVKDLIIVP